MISIMRTNGPLIICFLLIWMVLISQFGFWENFQEHGYVAIIMLFGAFVAGASSEGGGAIAFPALTLLYGLPPVIGASFSLAIQSFGMSSASCFIVRQKIPVCWVMVRWILPFAFIGLLFGKYYVAGTLDPRTTKIFFVSFWLSFALVLLRKHKKGGEAADDISLSSLADVLLIAVFGFMGGAISAVVGSGVDILSFSLMVLYFNLSEKIATPTTVIIMASVSVFATLVSIVDQGLDPLVLQFLVVAIPVVIVVAPLGARFINSRNRHFISRLLICILCVQYIGALIVLDVDLAAFLFSMLVIMVGGLCFYAFERSANFARRVTYY